MSLWHQHDLTFKSRSFERLGELRLSELRAYFGQNIRCRLNIVLSSDEENILKVAEVLVLGHQVVLVLVMKKCWLVLFLSPDGFFLVIRKNLAKGAALMDALLDLNSNLLLAVAPVKCCLEPSGLRQFTLKKRLD